jgi:hypothetical protein
MPIRRNKHHDGPQVTLWLLAGAWLSLLIVMIAYIFVVQHMATSVGQQAGVKAGIPVPKTIVRPVSLPSLFGTVVAIDADKVITVTSKQPYTAVVTAGVTKVISMNGTPFDLAQLHPGAVISATGHDLGHGRLQAVSIAVVSNP